MERIPFPRLKGEFITVYRPKGDVYRGLPSFFFTPGSYYESWTVNDFSILNDGGHWHLTGITHPTPPDFVDDFHPGQSWHDAEHMQFHATARGKTFADLMRKVGGEPKMKSFFLQMLKKADFNIIDFHYDDSVLL